MGELKLAPWRSLTAPWGSLVKLAPWRSIVKFALTNLRLESSEHLDERRKGNPRHDDTSSGYRPSLRTAREHPLLSLAAWKLRRGRHPQRRGSHHHLCPTAWKSHSLVLSLPSRQQPNQAAQPNLAALCDAEQATAFLGWTAKPGCTPSGSGPTASPGCTASSGCTPQATPRDQKPS